MQEKGEEEEEEAKEKEELLPQSLTVAHTLLAPLEGWEGSR